MRLFVKVKAGAREEKVIKVDENHFTVLVKEAPEKGRANKAVIKILSDYFKVPQADVEISAGHASGQKIIRIEK